MHASYGHPDHACEICCSENTDTCDHYCALLSNFENLTISLCIFIIAALLKISTVFHKIKVFDL